MAPLVIVFLPVGQLKLGKIGANDAKGFGPPDGAY
jgi:hypothetical protein